MSRSSFSRYHIFGSIVVMFLYRLVNTLEIFKTNGEFCPYVSVFSF